MPVTHQGVHQFLTNKAQQLASGHPARAHRGALLLVIIGHNKAVGDKQAQDAAVAQQEQQVPQL